MNASILRKYRQLSAAGYQASHAASAAKSWDAFQELESAGLVRIRAESEQDSYFGCYGEPEGYTDIYGRYHSPEQERKELCDIIERDGCWIVITEWRADEDSDWEWADSIGMCIYSDPTDPRENCYVPDLMRAAVDAATADRYSI